MRFSKLPLLLALSTLMGLVLFTSMQSLAREDALHLNIYGPGQKDLNILVAPAVALDNDKLASPRRAAKLRSTIQDNLGYLFFLQQFKKQELLGEKSISWIKAGDIDFKRLRMSDVDLVMTMGCRFLESGKAQVELRVYGAYTQNLLVGRGYVLSNEAQTIQAADRFCGALMEQLTGRSGFFNSRLAFSKQVGDKAKEIYTSTPSGRDRKKVSQCKGICLSPSWSWNAKQLAYTHIGSDSHELKIWHKDTEETESITLPGRSVISPAFTPQGDLVLSLDPRGNPDIYFLQENRKLGESLVESWGIDISPGFDANMEKMVFVSSRLGNPHIFIMDLNSREVSRLSMQGNYNTDPTISPSGRLVAYARRTQKGHRIVVHDTATGKVRPITAGAGNDENPSWGPDGYFLLFSSNRSGKYELFLTTRYGAGPKKIDTGAGSATAVDWGPEVR